MAVRVEDAPLLVRPEHVGGRVAWSDVVRCGALVLLRAEVAVRPTTELTPEVRALSLASLVPPRTVVGGTSAAWVHCGSPDAAAVEVVYPLGVHRPPPRHGRVARQSALLPRADVQRVEGRLRAVETAVRDAEQSQWSRSNPETRARAEGAAAQLESAIAGLEEDLAAANAKGDKRKVAEIESAITARRAWLEQVVKAA